ncbi:MAG: hypothetical protein Q8R25_04245, partial [bacterium]|nr:hypothetical protein [bacterium]
AQNETDGGMYRKGYGADWKCLRKSVKDGKVCWVPDKGISVKSEVVSYTVSGKLPFTALRRAAELIRQSEMQVVVARRVRELLQSDDS